MKSLYLVRHAKAIDRNSGIPDFERYLISEGEKETIKISRKFKDLRIKPDILVSSPAERAFETARIFAKQMGFREEEILKEDLLYNVSSSEVCLDVMHKFKNKYQAACLFGHEPMLSEFALLLTTVNYEKFPKSGIIGIDFDVHTWKEVSKGSGIPTFSLFPNEKVKRNKILRNILRQRINRGLKNVLFDFDAEVTRKWEKQIEQSGEEIARKFFKKLK